jgi:3-isopropylmalate dehydratase
MLKNGMLAIVLQPEQCRSLFNDAKEGLELEVDLENQEVRSPKRDPISFSVESFPRHCLLNGLDDIGLTLQKVSSIDEFEKRRTETWPWLDGFGYQGRIYTKADDIRVSSVAKGIDW